MKQLSDAPLAERDILIIADFNTEIKDGKPTCIFKIDQVLPTIEEVLKMNCRSLTITSHLGRPKNREEYSTKPVYDYLVTKIKKLQYGRIMEYLVNGKAMLSENTIQMMDNTRYYSDAELSNFYGLFDTVINDAFGLSHRDINVKAYAGLLMVKEIENLSKTKHADLVIMGGAKIKDKLSIITHFTGLVYLGGCLAITVLKSQGYEVGKHSKTEDYDSHDLKSRIVTMAEYANEDNKCSEVNINPEQDKKRDNEAFIGSEMHLNKEPHHLKCILCENKPGVQTCSDVSAIALPKCSFKRKSGLKIILPVDFFVVEHRNDEQNYKVKRVSEIDVNDECVDIGPKSIEQLRRLIGKSRSIFWNGPLGKIEIPKAGSTGILVKMLEESESETIIGGGETMISVVQYSSVENFTHVSTGGGAMLQFLSGGVMPGIASILQ